MKLDSPAGFAGTCNPKFFSFSNFSWGFGELYIYILYMNAPEYNFCSQSVPGWLFVT